MRKSAMHETVPLRSTIAQRRVSALVSVSRRPRSLLFSPGRSLVDAPDDGAKTSLVGCGARQRGSTPTPKYTNSPVGKGKPCPSDDMA